MVAQTSVKGKDILDDFRGTVHKINGSAVLEDDGRTSIAGDYTCGDLARPGQTGYAIVTNQLEEVPDHYPVTVVLEIP